MTKLDAVNLLLQAAGMSDVTSLTVPQAKMAVKTLDFTILELPYTSADFGLTFDDTPGGMPRLVQNYVVIRATRKFQKSTVGSDDFFVYSELDEVAAQKHLIQSRIIPSTILEATRIKLYSKYGFTNAIPSITLTSNAFTSLMATYEFQKTWLKPDEYVITSDEIYREEADFRVSLIANRIVPNAVLEDEINEFISVYGMLYTEMPSHILEYCKLKAAYKMQPVLIDKSERYVLKMEDIDNIEASLLTKLIVPLELYNKMLDEAFIDLGLGYLDEITRTAYKANEYITEYAKYKAAYYHQGSVIRYASKYVYTDKDIIKAKMRASKSMGNPSMLDNASVSRVTDRTNTPSPTAGSSSSSSTTIFKVGV